jgi:hypothetical protein
MMRCLAGMGLSVGSSLLLTPGIWTPASLPSLAAWYEAVDVDATLVKAVQPVLANGEFATASDWSGTNWTVGSGYAVHTPGAVNSLLQSGVAIIGNRYALDWNVAAITAGVVISEIGAGASRSVPGTYSEEGDNVNGNIRFLVSSPCDCSLDWVRNFTNLSRTRWNPTAGSLGGYLSQATATDQPWWDGTGLRFDGVADGLTASFAPAGLNLLHNSSECHYFVVHRGESADYEPLINTVLGANPGVFIRRKGSSDSYQVYVYDGSGYTVSATTAANYPANATRLVEWHKDGAGGWSLWVDGASAASGSGVTFPGGDATVAEVGNQSSNYHNGRINEFAIAGTMTASEVIGTRQYLAAKHGITLP